MDAPAADEIALKALLFLLDDRERAERFVALTGLDPATLRERAHDPALMAGILDHLAGDEPVLLAFCAEWNVDPADFGAALRALGYPDTAAD